MIKRQRLVSIGYGIAGLTGLFLAGCGGGGSSSTGTQTPPPGGGDNSRGVVFQVQPGTDVQALAQQYGFTVQDASADDNLYRFQPQPGADPQALADRLKNDPRCSAAEPDEGVHAPEAGTVSGDPIHLPFDFVRPTDSSYSVLAAAFNAGATTTPNPNTDQQVNLSPSRSVSLGAGVTVAVLDTGVQASHPVLSGHLLPGYNAIKPNAAPDDAADGTTNAVYGHGTMVSGIIARVAPDAKILPVRVLNGDGTGSIFQVVKGLRWAVSHGAQVVNLSFGTTTSSGILQGAIQDVRHAGVVVVASAGNSGRAEKDYPAGYSDVVAVASVEANDTKSSYSNYGSYISIAAPGTGITSTYPGGGFATWSGTSFAAPFVSGAAALVRATGVYRDADGVKQALRDTARSVDAVNPSFAGQIGRGVVDMGKAVHAE